MFYHFRQSNPGGSFVYDAERGLSTSVYIEADSYEEANERAKALGIYFYGVEQGLDCECCGDRWYPVRSHDEIETPPKKDAPFDEEIFSMKWEGEDRYESFVHLSDGTFYGSDEVVY